jgi:hypothetical protein
MERNDIFSIIISMFITGFIKIPLKETNPSRLNYLYKRSITKFDDFQ